jgi:hypothetical protein
LKETDDEELGTGTLVQAVDVLGEMRRGSLGVRAKAGARGILMRGCYGSLAT